MNTNSAIKRILVSAPLGFQLTPLSRRLGRFEVLREGGVEVRKTWFLGAHVLLHKSGYGRKYAVEQVVRAVGEYQPDEVLYIGVAGGLKPDFHLGDPFYVSSASLWPGDSNTLSIEQALGLKQLYASNEMPLLNRVKGGGRVRRGRLLSVDYFVNSVREKRKLGVAGYDLVDMEFASVAKALSEEVSANLTGLMVVSDSVHQGFPSWRPSVSENGRQLPVPPKLKVNMKKATQRLGSFAHLWLRELIKGDQ